MLTEGGDVIRTFSTSPEGTELPLPSGSGAHRVNWDLRYPPAYVAPGVDEPPAPNQYRDRISPIDGYTGGPLAVSGSYRVRLEAGGHTEEHTFEVRKDPRLGDDVTVEEMREDLEFGLEIRDRIGAIQHAVARLRTVLEELEETRGRTEDPALRDRADELIAGLEAVAGELYKHDERGDHAHIGPELTTSYARIGLMLITSDHGPPESARARWRDLQPEFEGRMAEVRRLLAEEVPSFNERLREAGMGPVYVPPRP